MKDNKTKLVDLIREITKFRNNRGWKKFHTPRNLATSIVLEASELLELFQWDLKALSAAQIRKDKERMEKIKQEMADIIIYTLSLSEILGVDISDSIQKKLDHNARKYPVNYFSRNGQDLKYYKKIKAEYRSGKVK